MICRLKGFQKETLQLGQHFFTWWTFVFACPPAWVKDVSLLSRRTNSHTQHVASKVAARCLKEQRVSLVVSVSSSLSCQADLRWQTCGLLSYLGRGVLCQMLLASWILSFEIVFWTVDNRNIERKNTSWNHQQKEEVNIMSSSFIPLVFTSFIFLFYSTSVFLFNMVSFCRCRENRAKRSTLISGIVVAQLAKVSKTENKGGGSSEGLTSAKTLLSIPRHLEVHYHTLQWLLFWESQTGKLS